MKIVVTILCVALVALSGCSKAAAPPSPTSTPTGDAFDTSKGGGGETAPGGFTTTKDEGSGTNSGSQTGTNTGTTTGTSQNGGGSSTSGTSTGSNQGSTGGTSTAPTNNSPSPSGGTYECTREGVNATIEAAKIVVSDFEGYRIRLDTKGTINGVEERVINEYYDPGRHEYYKRDSAGDNAEYVGPWGYEFSASSGASARIYDERPGGAGATMYAAVMDTYRESKTGIKSFLAASYEDFFASDVTNAEMQAQCGQSNIISLTKDIIGGNLTVQLDLSNGRPTYARYIAGNHDFEQFFLYGSEGTITSDPSSKTAPIKAPEVSVKTLDGHGEGSDSKAVRLEITAATMRLHDGNARIHVVDKATGEPFDARAASFSINAAIVNWNITGSDGTQTMHLQVTDNGDERFGPGDIVEGTLPSNYEVKFFDYITQKYYE